MAAPPQVANDIVANHMFTQHGHDLFKKAELQREAAKALIDYISSIDRARRGASEEEEAWVMFGSSSSSRRRITV